MSSYIYTMYEGADPGHGWVMNDPIFGPTPTLGACVPNIRRAVRIGDWIFAISGRVAGERQFVVGGFRVNEKISALTAFDRFPENRLRRDLSGQLLGNVIVDGNGQQHPEDAHSNFERRLENYIIGGEPVVLETPEEMNLGRTDTLPFLSQLLGREGNRVFDIIGRARTLSDQQANEMREWLLSLKR